MTAITLLNLTFVSWTWCSADIGGDRAMILVAAHQAAVLLLLLLLVVSPVLSVDLPSHGCYWTETCRSKWFGGGECDGSSYMVSDDSNECDRLCADSSSYPPCLPFHTRFLCCKPEIPKLTNRCARCKNKMDFGDEYICCSDCSEPFLISKDNKLGYCRTGAELAVQLKPQGFFLSYSLYRVLLYVQRLSSGLRARGWNAPLPVMVGSVIEMWVVSEVQKICQ